MADARASPMSFAPPTAPVLQARAWPGFGVERVLLRARHAVEFDVPPSGAHVLRVGLHGRRRDGETWADGAKRSIERALGGRVHLVPAGARVSGWGLPEGPWCFVNVRLDRDLGLVDPSLRFGELELRPRLAFQDAGLAATAAKLGALVAAGPAPHDRLYAEALAATLAIELARAHDAGRAAPGEPRHGLTARQLAQVRAFADAHLGEEVGLRDLAGAAGLSPWHFARAFRLATGATPFRWLQGLRLEQARRLLAATNLPVTGIALAVGFGTPSHFAAAFRRRHGATPSGFRAALR